MHYKLYCNEFTQTFSRNVLHGNKVSPGFMMDSINPHDVGMTQALGFREFRLQQFSETGPGGQLWSEHLEGDFAVFLGVFGKPDFPHAAAAEQPQQAKPRT